MRFRWNIKTSPVLQQSPFQLSNTLADAVIAQASTVAVCRCCGSRHAPGLGARVMQRVPFTSSPQFTTPGRELRLALMALFRISPTLYYRLLPSIKRNNIPVGRGITRDHFLVTLQKN